MLNKRFNLVVTVLALFFGLMLSACGQDSTNTATHDENLQSASSSETETTPTVEPTKVPDPSCEVVFTLYVMDEEVTSETFDVKGTFDDGWVEWDYVDDIEVNNWLDEQLSLANAQIISAGMQSLLKADIDHFFRDWSDTATLDSSLRCNQALSATASVYLQGKHPWRLSGGQTMVSFNDEDGTSAELALPDVTQIFHQFGSTSENIDAAPIINNWEKTDIPIVDAEGSFSIRWGSALATQAQKALSELDATIYYQTEGGITYGHINMP